MLSHKSACNSEIVELHLIRNLYGVGSNLYKLRMKLCTYIQNYRFSLNFWSFHPITSLLMREYCNQINVLVVIFHDRSTKVHQRPILGKAIPRRMYSTHNAEDTIINAHRYLRFV